VAAIFRVILVAGKWLLNAAGVQWLIADSAKKAAVFTFSCMFFYAVWRSFAGGFVPATLGLPDIPTEWKGSLEEAAAALNAWLPIAELWVMLKLYFNLYLSALSTRFAIRVMEFGRARG
jgi:hypothetical protein